MKHTSARILQIAWHIFFVCALIVMLYVLIVGGYAFGKALYTEKPVSTADVDVEFTITEKDSLWQVAQQLERRGLIADDVIFFLKAKLFDYTVYPGTYTLKPSMTDREILGLFSVDPSKEVEKQQ